MRVAAAVMVDPGLRTLLVRSAELGAIFSRMWHFPAIAVRRDAHAELERHLADEYAIVEPAWEALPLLRHTVTFRQITFEPWLVRVASLPAAARARIIPLDRVRERAVSSALRKIADAAYARQAPPT
jgi:adenine-specific DNA glycosylase